MKRIVLDVEATGTFNKANVYDLGGVVIDKHGNVLESFNYVIEDVFFNDGLMKNAYYADKLPQYYNEIKRGIRQVVSFAQARAMLFTLAKQYKVKEFWAYNANYDKNALQYTAQTYLHTDFIPANMHIEFKCIMGAFLSTLGHTCKYCRFAEKTEAGNVRVNAENAYRYISGDCTFIEEHTGLKDAEIEAQILIKCLKQRKKMDTEPKSLQSFKCYQEIQKLYKAM